MDTKQQYPTNVQNVSTSNSHKTEVSGSNPEWPTTLIHASQRLPLPPSTFRRVPASFFTGKTATRLYLFVDKPGMTALCIIFIGTAILSAGRVIRGKPH